MSFPPLGKPGVLIVEFRVPMKVQFFESAAAFRAWIEANHLTATELCVGFYQKSSRKPSITYPEALDEALCAGWIDGVRRKVSSDSYCIRFTPRRKASQWSAVNIKRMNELGKLGRILPAGLTAFKAAKAQDRKYSYEQRNEARFDRGSKQQFRSNIQAWEFFQSQPPWYRRTVTFWVTSAKKEETRRRRLDTLISDSADGRPIKPLSRPVPKRQEKKQ
jgi:uncharacterized protein YdeI (YjbR/CyaY-like superfamily)